MRISDWSSDVCSSDLVTRGSVPAGMVRVVATRSTARVDNCPDWSAPSHPNVQASTTSNFGCASQSNLAAMIADPNDLLAGKRSETRRVGKECVSTCRSSWSPYDQTNKLYNHN